MPRISRAMTKTLMVIRKSPGGTCFADASVVVVVDAVTPAINNDNDTLLCVICVETTLLACSVSQSFGSRNLLTKGALEVELN